MSNLDKLQQLNTNIPRETLVVATDGLVIKRPVTKNNHAPNKAWLKKQYHAQQVQESLQKTSGKCYFVPRMLEISSEEMFAIEQRVPGAPVTEKFFATLSDADKNVIYMGFAHFLNDINQSMPVLNQSDTFDIPEQQGDISFDKIIKKLKEHLSSKERDTLKKSKEWFDKHAINDASVVFCQGDMNEHNIFYDLKTKTVSFIDFADARYENARDMFHRDIARLLWIDIDKLITLYKKLPRTQPVITETNPTVESMRSKLYNIKCNGLEVLNANTRTFQIHLKMLKDEIAKLDKFFGTIKANEKLNATINKINGSDYQK
ncbi:MAG: phosphotransferase [Alphaproteobacteria bacterium]|nr:phosphotransferase [Alphaproteobacteria bacterium]